MYLKIVMLAIAMTTVSEAQTEKREDHPAYSPLESSRPAYGQNIGPKVYFDVGHNEFPSRGVESLKVLFRNDGYNVVSFGKSFSRENLRNCDILVVALALAEVNAHNRSSLSHNQLWSYPHPSAFSREEISELILWIREGGSLFLIAEHPPMSGAVADLAILLGAHMFDGSALSCQTASERWDDLKDNEFSQIVFGAVMADKWREHAARRSTAFERYGPILTNTGTLERHPIVQGRNKTEELKTIVTWGGSAFRTSKEWAPLLTLGPAAIGVVSPSRNIEGTDLPDLYFPLGGWLQGAARDLGKGRVVLQTDTSPIKYNDQYTLNVMHWLSGTLGGEQ